MATSATDYFYVGYTINAHMKSQTFTFNHYFRNLKWSSNASTNSLAFYYSLIFSDGTSVSMSSSGSNSMNANSSGGTWGPGGSVTLTSAYDGKTISYVQVYIECNGSLFKNGTPADGFHILYTHPDYGTTSIFQYSNPITWSENRLSSASFDSSSCIPNSQVTLSWLSTIGSNNSIKFYTITCAGQTAQTSISTSIKFSAPNSAGTYTYTITANSQCGPSPSIEARLIVYSGLPAPTGIKIGTTATSTLTTAYVGSTNKPSTLYVSWNPVTTNSSNNNAVTGYQVSLDGGVSWPYSTQDTSYRFGTPSEDATIVVRTNGSISNSSESDPVYVRYLSALDAPATNPTSNSHIETSSDIVVSWDALTLTGASSIQYSVRAGSSTILDNSTSTSTTIPMTYLTSGARTTITVTAIATANCGGIVTSSTSFDITRITSLANVVITGLYDVNKDNYNSTTIYNQAYNSLTITWDAISPSTAGDTVYYQIKYRLNGSSFSTLRSDLTTTSYTVNPITLRAAGKVLQFYIRAYDKNATSEVISSPVNILTPPSISADPIITCNQANQVTVNFNYTKDMGEDTIKYSIEMCQTSYSSYQSYCELKTGSFNNSDTGSYSQQFQIIPSNSSSADDLRLGLYNIVINQGHGRPKGKLRLIMYRQGFKQCVLQRQVEFSYDYRRSIISPAQFSATSISKTNSSLTNKWNPGDYCNFALTKQAVHKDAAGGSTENNDKFKRYYTLIINRTTELPFDDNSTTYRDQLPNTLSQNLDIEYQVRTTIVYADNYSVSAKYPILVKVKRWYGDATVLNQVSGNNSEISCVIKLPQTKYSDSCSNLSKIDYSFWVKQGSAQATTIRNGTISQNFSELGTIPLTTYKFTPTLKTDYLIYAQLTITNTSGGTLTVTTPAVLIRIGVVDMGIRKNRVGININNNFGLLSDPTTGALSIFNKPGGTDPVLQLSIDNLDAPFIHFKNNTGQTIGHWSYDKSSSSSTTRRFQFTQLAVNSSTSQEYTETYYLPAPSTAHTATPDPYAILTSRNVITVAQGGTGAKTAIAARTNLGIGEVFYNLDEPTKRPDNTNLKTGDIWLKPKS